jgi:hypothetical protein
MNNFGVCVFNYNRIRFNELVIRSLLRNPESQTLPFHFFIDGDPEQDASLAMVKKLIEDAPFPYKEIHVRGKQTGCYYNIADGIQQMFDDYGYDKVLAIEDDCLQASNSLRININLANYFDQFDNVGYTFSNSTCALSLEEKKQNLSVVSVSEGMLTNFTLRKKAWLAIRDIISDYKKLVNNFSEIDAAKIFEFLKDISSKRETVKGNLLNGREIRWFSIPIENWCISQDFVIAISLATKGYLPIATKVNFVKIIGVTGLNFNEKFFLKEGFDRVVIDEIPEFSDITDFTLVAS